MKKLILSAVGAVALAATPALAHDHGEKDKADKTEAEKMDTKMEEADAVIFLERDIDMLRKAQVFVAIDTSDDAVVQKAEWADWQGRDEDNTKRFDEHDLDDDGRIEFSEYYVAVTSS